MYFPPIRWWRCANVLVFVFGFLHIFVYVLIHAKLNARCWIRCSRYKHIFSVYGVIMFNTVQIIVSTKSCLKIQHTFIPSWILRFSDALPRTSYTRSHTARNKIGNSARIYTHRDDESAHEEPYTNKGCPWTWTWFSLSNCWVCWTQNPASRPPPLHPKNASGSTSMRWLASSPKQANPPRTHLTYYVALFSSPNADTMYGTLSLLRATDIFWFCDLIFECLKFTNTYQFKLSQHQQLILCCGN